jgi:hypothetical protein
MKNAGKLANGRLAALPSIDVASLPSEHFLNADPEEQTSQNNDEMPHTPQTLIVVDAFVLCPPEIISCPKLKTS